MEACAARYGSAIEEVSAEGIKALISAEKLRGTDLCLGPTGARMQTWNAFFGRKFVVQVEVSDGQEFPCGAPMPCTAGSSVRDSKSM